MIARVNSSLVSFHESFVKHVDETKPFFSKIEMLHYSVKIIFDVNNSLSSKFRIKKGCVRPIYHHEVAYIIYAKILSRLAFCFYDGFNFQLNMSILLPVRPSDNISSMKSEFLFNTITKFNEKQTVITAVIVEIHVMILCLNYM
jgi:hypothetical protein